CEVTTINVSEMEKKALSICKGVPLDHKEPIERIIKKITNEKMEQILYGAIQREPSALVVFDYTIWSAFETQRYKAFADYLFAQNQGFRNLPIELSALVYVERKVIGGRIAISKKRSAVYYNPFALHRLSESPWQMICQYATRKDVMPNEAGDTDDWFWLTRHETQGISLS